MKETNSRELLPLMEKIGHFLYHRRGGKRGQGKILRLLSAQTEMSLKELQSYLDIQSGSMSEIVTKMESKGLITKTNSEIDRRKVVLRITEEGIKTLQERQAEKNIQDQGLFNVLEEEEQEELQRILSKLLQNWEENFRGSFTEQMGRHHGQCRERRKDDNEPGSKSDSEDDSKSDNQER